jgi:hypothetical protein
MRSAWRKGLVPRGLKIAEFRLEIEKAKAKDPTFAKRRQKWGTGLKPFNLRSEI